MQKKLNKYIAGENEERVGGFDFFSNKAKNNAKGGGASKENMNAIHDFYVDGKKVKSPDMLPWGSIELIFNHKNIWANRQHQNPSKIMYEIWNTDQWRPFLSFWDGKNEWPWLNKVGSFHSISNMEAPITPEEIIRIQTMVLKDIKFTISCQRSGLNLESNFKSPVKSSYFRKTS